MPIVIGYWKIRGLAQPIRLLLEYHGLKYNEEVFECGPAPNYDRKMWLDKKSNIGLDFPNLPYYKDEDITLTQSEAILRYIAEKNNMGGANPKERALLSMINGAVNDLRWAFIRICYSPDFEKLKPEFMASLPDKLKTFEEYLKTHFWISGNKLDYPDFNLYDLLDTLKALESSCLDAFPKLKDYVMKFEASRNKTDVFLHNNRCFWKPVGFISNSHRSTFMITKCSIDQRYGTTLDTNFQSRFHFLWVYYMILKENLGAAPLYLPVKS
ncbi:hypothetical protein EG68_10140 [Paragonimus skrjabini miyazakii]|uniref:glutathione transferase n=1 Tax=Paragonimus skrjabini miyazakii TaxID=59628 RepID=A0A8S9YGA2_9TREM|nr:hypothetical protein EG68_10140 [Paragonimus skrjabini miyazakii]